MPELLKQKNTNNNHIVRNMWILGSLLILGGIYIGWLSNFGAITRSNRLDGTLGILLGLYISSHPAANLLDMLLFIRADIREGLISTGSGQLWLLLNLITFIAAWAVIFTGILRFVSRSV